MARHGILYGGARSSQRALAALRLLMVLCWDWNRRFRDPKARDGQQADFSL